jgi:saccharopine dehydrogenase (NADP+, L-glutamate forming)
VKGENNSATAMAKTVGLPLGIAAKLLLNGDLQLRGLHIPILPEIYEPVLKSLEAEGIQFLEQHKSE